MKHHVIYYNKVRTYNHLHNEVLIVYYILKKLLTVVVISWTIFWWHANGE